MSLKLSDLDWSELWHEEEPNAIGAAQSKVITSFGLTQQVYKFSGGLGQGSERYMPLRNGLHLEICNYELWEDVTISSRYCTKRSGWIS
jgi:AraC family transcriptional regulator, transcriptional activator of the genes for pyochelin and ferripyochelin receptors